MIFEQLQASHTALTSSIYSLLPTIPPPFHLFIFGAQRVCVMRRCGIVSLSLLIPLGLLISLLIACIT